MNHFRLQFQVEKDVQEDKRYTTSQDKLEMHGVIARQLTWHGRILAIRESFFHENNFSDQVHRKNNFPWK